MFYLTLLMHTASIRETDMGATHDRRPHVVLGAGGGTGTAVVNELAERGLPVRRVTRVPDAAGGTMVETVAADLTDVEQTLRAIEGAAVVYHAANPPYHRWLKLFPLLNRSILAATSRVGARLVYADNLYMYGPDASLMTEETPARAKDSKGALRAQLANELLEANRAGDCEVAIGRSSDYFGPAGTSSAIGERVFSAALAGKAVPWLGEPDVPHSVAYLPDIARALVTLGCSEQAAGKVWHLPSSGAPTGREYVAAIGAALGQELKIRPTPRWMVRMAGLVSPQIREVAGVMYQWEAPFVSSDARFQASFGPQPATPLPQAVSQTAAWFARRGGAAAAVQMVP
jgi:nucleoside-diphosphate-sugar epimerase